MLTEVSVECLDAIDIPHKIAYMRSKGLILVLYPFYRLWMVVGARISAEYYHKYQILTLALG